jgi:hypothetical protein
VADNFASFLSVREAALLQLIESVTGKKIPRLPRPETIELNDEEDDEDENS